MSGPLKAATAQPRNPLHGITLEAVLAELVAHFGWAELGTRIPIHSFRTDPSLRSSLTFLRRTPWARAKVEGLYLFMRRAQRREQAKEWTGGQIGPRHDAAAAVAAAAVPPRGRTVAAHRPAARRERRQDR